MGDFITPAMLVLSTVNEQRQAQARNKLQKQQVDAQRQALQTQYDAAERERLKKLERARAAQRAGFAAAGISADGSAQAADENLLAESAEEGSNLARAFQDRMNSLELSGRVNLLRQRDNDLTSLLGMARGLGRGSDKGGGKSGFAFFPDEEF